MTRIQTTLRHLRRRRGLTQHQLEIALGIPHVIYSMLENGRIVHPHLYATKKLEDLFHLSISKLLQPYDPREDSEDLLVLEGHLRKLRESETNMLETIGLELIDHLQTARGWDVKKLEELLRVIRRQMRAIQGEMLSRQT